MQLDTRLRFLILEKNGLRLADASATQKGNNEVVSSDRKRHFQDDDAEESVVACTHEADLPQNTNGNDEVIIIVDIRRIQKKVREKIVPMPCKGDLDFLGNCCVTVAHLLDQVRCPCGGTVFFGS